MKGSALFLQLYCAFLNNSFKKIIRNLKCKFWTKFLTLNYHFIDAYL